MCVVAACPGEGRCLDAFRAVLMSQTCEGGRERWFTSTRQLQLVSVELCRACRGVPDFKVHIEEKTPRGVWCTRQSQLPLNMPVSIRVPVLRAFHFTWDLPLDVLVENAAIELWASSDVLCLRGSISAASLESVVWPRTLKRMELDFRSGFSWENAVAAILATPIARGFLQPTHPGGCVATIP